MKKLISWFQGWSRYFLYYSKEIIKIDLSWLIKKHIREQIQIRINSMNRECYNSGSCIECGCATTALQMANKACEGDCYPKITTSKYLWNNFVTDSQLFPKNHFKNWRLKNNKFTRE